jgi:hypothetical protein
VVRSDEFKPDSPRDALISQPNCTKCPMVEDYTLVGVYCFAPKSRSGRSRRAFSGEARKSVRWDRRRSRMCGARLRWKH